MIELINAFLGRSNQSNQAVVEIYTWQTCPYCIRAKFLLWRKGINFMEYKIDGDTEARNTMAIRANGKRSVPQIFINNEHIGGCDDLHRLEREGKLTALFHGN